MSHAIYWLLVSSSGWSQEFLLCPSLPTGESDDPGSDLPRQGLRLALEYGLQRPACLRPRDLASLHSNTSVPN
eukprot:scaffold80_cov382-Prasinococcus_capsulatus_cf.AAC.4